MIFVVFSTKGLFKFSKHWFLFFSCRSLFHLCEIIVCIFGGHVILYRQAFLFTELHHCRACINFSHVICQYQ